MFISLSKMLQRKILGVMKVFLSLDVKMLLFSCKLKKKMKNNTLILYLDPKKKKTIMDTNLRHKSLKHILVLTTKDMGDINIFKIRKTYWLVFISSFNVCISQRS